jgi:hypothetical protein
MNLARPLKAGKRLQSWAPVALATIELPNQPSLTRRQKEATPFPALRGRAKFRPPLRGEDYKASGPEQTVRGIGTRLNVYSQLSARRPFRFYVNMVAINLRTR